MTNDNRSDDVLLWHSARDNDGQAFAIIIRRYQGQVIRFATRLFNGDIHAGSDIAQDTFIRLWESRHTYVACGKLLPYLLRIAYNLCMSRLRSPESRTRRMDETESVAARDTPMELSFAVKDAIQALPESQRVVFILHEYEGLSYKEIAEVLSIAMGTVASRKNSAVQALRISLAPLLGQKSEVTHEQTN